MKSVEYLSIINIIVHNDQKVSHCKKKKYIQNWKKYVDACNIQHHNVFFFSPRSSLSMIHFPRGRSSLAIIIFVEYHSRLVSINFREFLWPESNSIRRIVMSYIVDVFFDWVAKCPGFLGFRSLIAQSNLQNIELYYT